MHPQRGDGNFITQFSPAQPNGPIGIGRPGEPDVTLFDHGAAALAIDTGVDDHITITSFALDGGHTKDLKDFCIDPSFSHKGDYSFAVLEKLLHSSHSTGKGCYVNSREDSAAYRRQGREERAARPRPQYLVASVPCLRPGRLSPSRSIVARSFRPRPRDKWAKTFHPGAQLENWAKTFHPFLQEEAKTGFHPRGSQTGENIFTHSRSLWVKIGTMYGYGYSSQLAWRIRDAHKKNPEKRPAELARELDTTPKYVSKILRRARVAKFRTGPDKAKPPAPAVLRHHNNNSAAKPAASKKPATVKKGRTKR